MAARLLYPDPGGQIYCWFFSDDGFLIATSLYFLTNKIWSHKTPSTPFRDGNSTPNIKVIGVLTNHGASPHDMGNRLAVLGKAVAHNLFANRNPVGEAIRINRVSLEVIGVLVAMNGGDQDDVIYIPIHTALRRLFNLTYINNIFVQAQGFESIERAAREIQDILRERHRLRDKPNDFTIQSQAGIIKTEQETSQTFTNLLGAVAGISLLVGGFGILAIILVSIKVRTREIGARRRSVPSGGISCFSIWWCPLS